MLSIDKHINVIGCHIIIIKSASGFKYTWLVQQRWSDIS